MGRMIDVDVAEKMLRKYADDVGCNRGEIELANGILKAVCYLDNVPTAFDTEKVIEQLGEMSFERYGNEGMGGQMVVALDDVVDVFRKGGVNE